MRALAKPWLPQKLVPVFLIATVGGAVAGGVLGVVLACVLASRGASTDIIVQASNVLGFLVDMPISFFTFRWSVRTMIVEAVLAIEPPPAP